MSANGPDARQALNVLTDLAPGAETSSRLNVDERDRASLTYDALDLFTNRFGGYRPRGSENYERLAPLMKRSALHREDGILRVGWIWLAGTSATGKRVMFPLVSVPVGSPSRRRKAMTGDSLLSSSGDPELTDLIDDPMLRDQLERSINYSDGRLHGQTHTTHPDFLRLQTDLLDWGERAAEAAGFPTRLWRGGLPGPRQLSSDLMLLAKVMLYIAEPAYRSATVSSALRGWDAQSAQKSAFGAVYGFGAVSEDRWGGEPTVMSSMQLTPTQAEAVTRSRDKLVTVVSGPPGTGKTHAIAAAAFDAVERGESVLVAAPTPAAVDALVTLLTNTPGPDPVVFGSNDQRMIVADRLGQGGGRLVTNESAEAARDRFEASLKSAASIRSATEALLEAEIMASHDDPALAMHARSIAPAWFDSNADLDRPLGLLIEHDQVNGWLSRRRRNRRVRALARHAGASVSSLDQLRDALQVAIARAKAIELEASGGLDLEATWPRLVAAEKQRRVHQGKWLYAATHSETRVGRRERATMATVAAALRAGRAVRRQKLGEIEGSALTRALPLWVGTLRDIDDLLPRTGAMFDLVIVDEASQVDQVTAAPALLRGTRLMAVGDPKQLRHVSFLSDARIAEAIERNQITDQELAGRLDVRRLTLFDLAAGISQTLFLDEHFRSAPHLIDFSARRFYDGTLQVATRHPTNQSLDCISVRFIDGVRADSGVNASEIDEVISLIKNQQEDRAGHRAPMTVGVVSPYRAHAEALEKRIVDEFSLAEIDHLDLRVGTVHGFQGCERDVIIVTLSLDPGSSQQTKAFLSDPHLFNVMVTRARHEIIVVTCLDEATPGIVGDYIRHGSSPPLSPTDRSAPGHRLRSLAADLGRSGVSTITNYPVGRHCIDLVIGVGHDAVGVTIGVHPDGPKAHVDRYLALRALGWNITEIFDSRWGDRDEELAVTLATHATT